MVEEIAGFEHDFFHVQYGPVGPQWVDDAMLARIAEASATDGTPRAHASLRDGVSEGMGKPPPIPAVC
jgi:5-methylthioadenosine/S-adenosylhomocysteine deaminase